MRRDRYLNARLRQRTAFVPSQRSMNNNQAYNNQIDSYLQNADKQELSRMLQLIQNRLNTMYW